MKKIIQTIAIVLIIGMCGGGLMAAKDYYHKDVRVIDVRNTEIDVIDKQGDVWTVTDIEPNTFTQHDKFTLLMKDTGVKHYYIDDTIIRIL